MDERKLTPTELRAIEGKFPVESCATHEVVDALLEAQLAKADKAHPDRDKLREKIEAILKEPDVSGMDWSIGSHILASWRVGFTDQLLSLFPISSKKKKRR